MPTRDVLIVDPNQAFAQILQENLQESGAYVVSVASSGSAAVGMTAAGSFHIAIVDTLVSDTDPASLLAALRERDPHLHVAMIPPFGEELPDELTALDIQGVLHKPFIPGRLVSLVQSFLQRKVLTAPPSRADVLRGRLGELQPLLDTFCGEVSARAMALICQGELVTYAGQAPYGEGLPLVGLVEDSLEVSGRLATFFGEERGHLALLSFVGERLGLYALCFHEDLVLVVAPGDGVPQGVVHLAIRRVAASISEALDARPQP